MQVGLSASTLFTFYGVACGTTVTLGVKAHDASAGVGPLWTTMDHRARHGPTPPLLRCQLIAADRLIIADHPIVGDAQCWVGKEFETRVVDRVLRKLRDSTALPQGHMDPGSSLGQARMRCADTPAAARLSRRNVICGSLGRGTALDEGADITSRHPR